jgi:hypothetical protein
VAIGCFASGVPNDGYGYDQNVVVMTNRMSNAYDAAGTVFLAGNTDGGSGTMWSGNYMDGNPSEAVRQPIAPC